MGKRLTPATFFLPDHDPSLFAAEDNGSTLEKTYIRETEWRASLLLFLIVLGVSATLGSIIVHGSMRPEEFAALTIAPLIGVTWMVSALRKIVKDPVAAARRELELAA